MASDNAGHMVKVRFTQDVDTDLSHPPLIAGEPQFSVYSSAPFYIHKNSIIINEPAKLIERISTIVFRYSANAASQKGEDAHSNVPISFHELHNITRSCTLPELTAETLEPWTKKPATIELDMVVKLQHDEDDQESCPVRVPLMFNFVHCDTYRSICAPQVVWHEGSSSCIRISPNSQSSIASHRRERMS